MGFVRVVHSTGRDIMYARALFYSESSGMAQHAACELHTAMNNRSLDSSLGMTLHAHPLHQVFCDRVMETHAPLC